MANSKLLTLSEIFNDNIFRIPDYQRGFAWGNQQLDDFLSDLKNLDNNRIHYTGMITVEHKDNEEYCYIIDGQQRFTTIMILLKVILDKFDRDDWLDDKEQIDCVKKYLYRQTGSKKKNIKVIFGYEKDNPSNCFYKTKILELKDTESFNVAQETLYTKNLKNAKNYFTKQLKKISKEEAVVYFNKITKQLKFNFYEIDDELDEFVTFETMNNRGKPLTTLELLKNRLIYLTTLLNNEDYEIQKLRKEINDAWKTIYEFLGKNDRDNITDDEFLKFHWIMYFTYSRSKANAEKDYLLNKHFTQQNIFKGEEEDHYIEYNHIEAYVLNIQKAITKYYDLMNPNKSNYNDEIKLWLSKLNNVGFGSAFKPIIMAILVEDISNEKILKILKIAERYVFLSFIISGKRSSSGKYKLYKCASEFYKEKNIDNLISNIEEEFERTASVNIENFESDISNLYKENKLGWYGWKKGIYYLLYEYELSLQKKIKGGKQKLQWEDIKKETIEHIYPQVPNDKCWTDIFPSDNQEKNNPLHSLGNLVLISHSKNSSLKNKCFDEKKESFSTGSYSEIEVSKNKQWTPQEIKIRGRKILQFLSERWDVPITEDTIDRVL